jgi:hypothetical protein
MPKNLKSGRLSVLRVFASGATAALFCTLALGAQTAGPGKGRQVVDRAIAALGGDRFLQMHSRMASGRIYSFFHDEMNGYDVTTIYTEYLDNKPAKGLWVRERELLGKKRDYSYLYLEDQGWDVTFRGARPLPDDIWERYVRTTRNDILYLLRFRRDEPGMLYDYIGSEVHISTHVEVVDITDASGLTVRVYFDHNSFLPVRQSFSWLDPVTKQHNDEVTQFDKWRDANGVQWPFTIERHRNGYKTYQIFANKVEIDQPLPPNIFELPPGAKALKKVN